MGREVAGGELGVGERERKCGISCRLGPTFIDFQGRGAGRVEGKRGGEGDILSGKASERIILFPQVIRRVVGMGWGEGR